MKTQHEADYVVFVGRMQPPHLAHIEIVYRALQRGKKVIILIGSANQPRTITNPWTWKERADMIRACFPPEDQDRLKFRPLSDVVGDTVWSLQVQEQVADVVNHDIRTQEFLDVNFKPVIKMIGHEKDQSSYYLKMFPQWKGIEVENIDDLHATDIRNMMFEKGEVDWGVSVPSGIRDYIGAFMLTEAYETLWSEYNFIKQYKQAWDKAPYPPTFNTVDAVVVQSGHILLVRRRAAPGKGLWALPGGFLNADERITDAVIRELREETKLKTPLPVLQGKIENGKNMKVFDDPKRSLRGRTITFAHYFELKSGPLPKVKGSDDADKAKWVPLSVFNKMEDQLFEDHFRIVQHFVDSSED